MSINLEPGAEPVPGYKLVRKLGQGGFGEVWQATAPGGVGVALKFVRLDTEQAAPELRAFDVIRNIRHPHLLDVQFALQVDDRLIIAMPLCERSMMDRLRECQAQNLPGLPRDELLGYMGELAQAIDFLNEPRHPSGDGGLIGVQHRDIKPQNVFVVGGSVRLADFGVAKAFEASTGQHTGSLSPHYAAPEAIEGRVTRWTDQYSLAVTYCHLRTGRRPFGGDSAMQVLYQHVHEPPDLTGLPEEERGVLARALAKRPEERWPTCHAFVHGLEAAALAEDARLGPEVAAAFDETLVDHAGPPTEVATKLAQDRRLGTGPETGGGVGEESGVAAEEGPRHRGRRLALVGLVAIGGPAALAAVLFLPRSSPTSKAGPDIVPVAKESVAPVEAEVPRVIPRDEPKQPQTPEPPPDPPAHVPAADPPTPAPPVVTLAAARPADTNTDLAQQARAVLKKYCYRCHGVRFEVPGYNVLDRDGLVAKRGEDEQPYVVPGKPEGSALWERVGVEKDMPPAGPKPSDAERALLGRWITAGAPFPQVDPSSRPLKREKDVLTAIRDHQRQVRESDRTSQRYFTLANLYNNKGVGDDELRLARAALAKLVNSMSWKPDIVVPRAVDREETVFALDLRDVGWDEREIWKEILSRYPYGLKHDKDPDAPTRALAEEVYELTGTSVPDVRVDWFVAIAARPPLYHTLLDLPRTALALERTLKVDTQADFLRDKLARAGFATSGISSQNRLVDRHVALYGAYWKSYDFRRNEGTGNIVRFPLGPVFADHPFPRQAFEHAGGEIIFNLPNGLQGYLLVNAQGDRIDEGPIDIVGDALKTSGTSAIVNGLSCLACHQHGMVRFKDTVREGIAVGGSARDKAERLFAEQGALDQLLAKDEGRFLKALEEATGGFLKAGGDREKPIRDFPEPVGAVARAYLKDLGADDVAAELALGDPKELTAMIRASAQLRQLGLAPLLRGAAIKRTEWDSLEGRFLSTFQDVARELDLGTPFRVF